MRRRYYSTNCQHIMIIQGGLFVRAGCLLLLSLLCFSSLLRTDAFATNLEAATKARGSIGSESLFRHENRRYSLLALRGASSPRDDSEITEELKDFKGEAAGLFGNIRIPAALFAGASAGAAFALPVAVGKESLKLGLVKRVYALLMMSALSSQVVAVVVSTLVLSRLSTSSNNLPLAASLTDFLRSNYELEFIAVRWHFLSGLLFFLVGTGLRAWITIACPIIAKSALGIIVSSTLLCVAFVQDESSEASSGAWLDGFFQLPLRYASLLAKRSFVSWKRPGQSMINPLFALATLATAYTMLYTLGKGPHILQWLMASAAAP